MQSLKWSVISFTEKGADAVLTFIISIKMLTNTIVILFIFFVLWNLKS